MEPPATIVATEEAGALIMRAEGSWLVASATELDRRLHALDLPTGRRVTLDLAGVDRLDTAGAWLLLRTEHALNARGNSVALANVRNSFAPLLDQLRARGAGEPLPHPVPPHHTLVGFVARIGEITLAVAHRIYSMLGFGGLVSATFANSLLHPKRLRVIATLVQMEQTGVNAMPIVGLLSFLIGVVMAYQGADQLRRFGAEIYTVNLLGIAILRELGVLLSAIIIAGRSGSAFTAQIGTMQVNQEIDALHTLGLDPVEVLVLPRVLRPRPDVAAAGFLCRCDGDARRLPDDLGDARHHDPGLSRSAARRHHRMDLVGGRHQGAVLCLDHRHGRLL